jgi:hypothetical protein
MLAGAFWAVTALGLFGLISLLSTYRSMWIDGARSGSIHAVYARLCFDSSFEFRVSSFEFRVSGFGLKVLIAGWEN